MNEGVQTTIVPVTNIAHAKALYRALLGVEPYRDDAYDVGFHIGNQDVGVSPNGHRQGMTGPVSYWQVHDVNETLERLRNAGAQAQHAVKDLGDGKLIATVKDVDGNGIGLAQLP